MSNRVASSSGSDSDSSSDDGRYNRLKSTVRRTSGSERKKHLSGSEEEGQYTGSDSEGEQKPKDARDNPVKDIRSDERFNKSRSKSPDQDETRREEKEDKTRDRHNRDRRPRNRRDEYNNRRNDERANRRYENSGGRDLSRRSPVDDGDRSRRDRRGDGDRRRNNRDGDRSLNESNGDRERSRRDRDDDEGRARNKENNDERAEQKRRRDDNEQGGNNEISKDANGSVPKRAKKEDLLTTKTGGAYIPPARLRMMQESITDKSSEAYQRISWEALKKSINGLVNKVNVSNIANIVRELFGENLVRGRGLIARSIIQAQAASHTFTHVYAALVAIINTKFPQNGELIMKRLIIQFKRGYKRNDKTICSSATKFLAHLVNQQVAHEVIALEILTLLLENPSDDSVEIAVGFLKECGQKLTDVSPRGIHAIFERLRNILHEAAIDKRVQYMIEVMFAVRKDGFKDHVSVLDELDLVEEDEQFTHLLTLEDVTDTEDMLNVFRADPEFLENEEKYKEIKKGILDSDSSDDGESGSGSGSDSDSDEEAEDEEAKQVIIDSTETNLVALRRTIYLTIQSSLDFEECAHKLMKMELKPGQEAEVCNMILDCCAQQRTFEKFYALLGQRFCQIDKKFVGPYEQIFQEQYDTIHRLETAKLRNVAKFFAHLLHTDAISWGVIQCMKMNEEDTTSSSRIFVKILFQELSEFMGLPKLNTRLKDVTLAPFFEGLFPRDNPRNTRFAINFFTSIGLGGLTDELRDHLKNMPKKAPVKPESDSSSSDSDSSSDDSSSSSDSDSSSDSEPTPKKSKKKEQQHKKTNSDSKKSKKKPSKTPEESDSDSETEKVEKESRHRKGQEKQGQEKHITSRRGKENLRYDEPESDRTSRKNSAKKRRDKIPDEGSESDERSGRRREKKESMDDNERYSKRRDDRHEGRSKPSNKDEKYAKRNERPGREKHSDGVSRSSKHRR